VLREKGGKKGHELLIRSVGKGKSVENLFRAGKRREGDCHSEGGEESDGVEKSKRGNDLLQITGGDLGFDSTLGKGKRGRKRRLIIENWGVREMKTREKKKESTVVQKKVVGKSFLCVDQDFKLRVPPKNVKVDADGIRSAEDRGK